MQVVFEINMSTSKISKNRGRNKELCKEARTIEKELWGVVLKEKNTKKDRYLGEMYLLSVLPPKILNKLDWSNLISSLLFLDVGRVCLSNSVKDVVPFVPPVQGEHMNSILNRLAVIRNEFISINTGLAVTICKKFMWVDEWDDLFQEALIGLMHAVDRFDPHRNNQFSTYAVWWVKHKVSRYIENSSSFIRVPVHARHQLRVISRFVQWYIENYPSYPSEYEVSKYTGISTVKVRYLLAVYNSNSTMCSLDEVKGDEDNMQLYTTVSGNSLNPERELEKTDANSLVNELLSTITNPQHKSVIIMRFGLDGGGERTLEEIGNKWGVTRERIRQIQNIALGRLRCHANQLKWKKN